MKQLLEAGVHFGHQTKKWNPKMRDYIFGEKSGIYIIDIQKTAEALDKACEYLRDIVARGGSILFVGTKKQAQAIIKEEALRCGMFYVSERWLGGMLTNFQTVRKSVKRLKDLEKMKEDGTFELLSKKEQSQLTKEADKLRKNLDGVKNMEKLPEALFIIDSKSEEISVKEANKLSIPVVALIDTNCNPDVVDYPIPGNDDAIRAIKLVTSLISECVSEGKKMFVDSVPAAETDKAIEQEQLGAEALAEAKPEVPGEELIEEVIEEKTPEDGKRKLPKAKILKEKPAFKPKRK